MMIMQDGILFTLVIQEIKDKHMQELSLEVEQKKENIKIIYTSYQMYSPSMLQEINGTHHTVV